MLNRFEKKFLERVRVRRLVKRHERVLIALSGGGDSVALLSLFAAVRPVLSLTLAAAHCNFLLRGKASEDDEKFCIKLCASLGVPLYTERFETRRISEARRTSIEETARDLRYSFFHRLADEHGYAKIATAHHARDNAETVLFNLARGASLLGLRGIREVSGKIIRPLLFAEKPELLAYLTEKNQAFRTDRSNFSTDADRNFLRLKVIPLLEKRFEHKLIPNLLRLADNAAELEAFLDGYFSKRLTPYQTEFSVAFFLPMSVFERKEIFKRVLLRFGVEPHAKLLERLSGLVGLQSGRKVVITKKLEAVRRGDGIAFVET